MEVFEGKYDAFVTLHRNAEQFLFNFPTILPCAKVTMMTKRPMTTFSLKFERNPTNVFDESTMFERGPMGDGIYIFDRECALADGPTARPPRWRSAS